MRNALRYLVFLIWLIDILNIDFLVNGVHIAQFLDVTIPINFWFWTLYFLLSPNYSEVIKEIK